MELIDKDALVAEIERIIEEPAPSHDSQCSWEDGYYCGLCKAESIIDNLEVKEVDLEEEFNNFLDNIEGVPRMWHSDEQIEWGKDIARHFFELGLNTQQNLDIDITNIDKIIEENGVDPNSKEAKMFKESYYMALEKLKAQKGE